MFDAIITLISFQLYVMSYETSSFSAPLIHYFITLYQSIQACYLCTVETAPSSQSENITHPKFAKQKTYWAQVEGEPGPSALEELCTGVELNDGRTRPAKARLMAEPVDLWRRVPPIRYRASITTTWLELIITEGRNRQVRRMTAAVGYPTLRLLRVRIGDWKLGELQPGQWREA